MAKYSHQTTASRAPSTKIRFFWKPEGKGKVGNHVMCQWFQASFEEFGIKYENAEQYMMANKAKLFGDTQAQRKIMAEKDPKVVKELGRSIKGFKSDLWDKYAQNIVRRGNFLKFNQNPELKEFLVSTGDDILAESSPFDTIWGIGMGDRDKKHKDPINWKGQNLLGYILMDVRDQLAKQSA